MTDITGLIALFTMGLLGSTHCVGMCGGITTALGMAVQGRGRYDRLILTLLYNLGRIASYATAGLVAALIGALGRDHLALGPVLRLVAGVIMIVLGLYIAGWWRGLVRLEHIGQHVWKYLQPIGQRLLPVTGPGRALALGAVWGWLPCGLVYSAVVLTLAMASPWQGVLGMVFFGLGTLPVMLVMGLASGGLLRRLQTRGIRAAAGVMLIVFGVWQLLQPGMHGDHHEHHATPHAHEHAAAGHGGNHGSDRDAAPETGPDTGHEVREDTHHQHHGEH